MKNIKITIPISEFEFLIAEDVVVGILTEMLRTYEYSYIEKKEVKDLLERRTYTTSNNEGEVTITSERYTRLLRMSVHLNAVRDYYRTQKDDSLSKADMKRLMGCITLNPAKGGDEDE